METEPHQEYGKEEREPGRQERRMDKPTNFHREKIGHLQRIKNENGMSLSTAITEG